MHESIVVLPTVGREGGENFLTAKHQLITNRKLSLDKWQDINWFKIINECNNHWVKAWKEDIIHVDSKCHSRDYLVKQKTWYHKGKIWQTWDSGLSNAMLLGRQHRLFLPNTFNMNLTKRKPPDKLKLWDSQHNSFTIHLKNVNIIKRTFPTPAKW